MKKKIDWGEVVGNTLGCIVVGLVVFSIWMYTSAFADLRDYRMRRVEHAVGVPHKLGTDWANDLAKWRAEDDKGERP